MVEAETHASHLVEAEAQLCKSLLDDGTAQERDNDDNRSEDRNSSKISECHEQLEQLKNMTKKSDAPEALESGGQLQARAVVVVPSRRGRQPNSLIKPEKGYEHSGITGGQNSLEIPRKRKNREKVSNLLNYSSPEKSPFQSEPEKKNKPSLFPPRMSYFDSTSPIPLDQSDGGKSLPRKGRPKQKERMVSQDVNLDMLDAKGVLLEDQLKKKSLHGSDGRLRIGSYKIKDAEEKPGRYSRRKKPAGENNMETSSGVKNVVIKKEKDILSDSEGKPMFLLRMKDRKKGMDDKETEKPEVPRSLELSMSMVKN